MFINFYGLPLAKSSGSSFWPILGIIANVQNSVPFCVENFHGFQKPSIANAYLDESTKEAVEITEKGFTFCGRSYDFQIIGVILYTKTFITYSKSHTGRFSCSKGEREGDYYKNRIVFLETIEPYRKDNYLRTQSQPKHHVGTSVLELLKDLDMVRDFPLDPMHLLYLGVMRTLILYWMKGSLKARLQKDRSINYVASWKIFVISYQKNLLVKQDGGKPRKLDFFF